MAYDPAVQPCPRCSVPMPADARFCRNCGLTQAEADAARLRPAVAAAPVAAAVWQPASASARDPFAQGRRSRVFRDFPAAAFDEGTPQSTFWTSAWGILVVVCLVLLVLSISGIAIFYYSSICSLGERNQLRGDIPLPCGTTFQDHLNRSNSGTTGKGSEEWVYTVDGTTPAQIQLFYMQQLPQNGWTLPDKAQAFIQSDPTLKSDTLVACKSGTVLVIAGIAGPNPTTAPVKSPTPTATPIIDPDDGIQAPTDGSLLDIILIPGQNLAQSGTLQALNDPDCSG